MERFFGNSQGWFEIIRRESRRWELHEKIRIANTFVTLHNVFIRMQQYYASITGDTTVCDIRWIMENESECMIKSNEERGINVMRNNNVVLVEVEEEAGRYMCCVICNLQITKSTSDFKRTS